MPSQQEAPRIKLDAFLKGVSPSVKALNLELFADVETFADAEAKRKANPKPCRVGRPVARSEKKATPPPLPEPTRKGPTPRDQIVPLFHDSETPDTVDEAFALDAMILVCKGIEASCRFAAKLLWVAFALSCGRSILRNRGL